MIGYDFYRIYEPIRLHFESSYDVFKYRGKIRYGSRDTYEKRNDKYCFERVARKCGSPKVAGQICLSNFVYNDRLWVHHDYNELSEVYHKWKGVISDIRTRFSDQIDQLVQIAQEHDITPEAMFEPTPSGKYPPAMQLFLHGKIHKETVVILAHFKDFMTDWVDRFDFDPLVSDQLFLLKKYRPFIITKENQRDFHEATCRIF